MDLLLTAPGVHSRMDFYQVGDPGHYRDVLELEETI